MRTTSHRPAKRVSRCLLAAVSSLLVTVAGCGSADNASGSAADNATPVAGGTLNIALGGDPQTLNPQALSSNNADVTRAVVDSLLALDPATNKPVPWLAQSYEVSPDGTRFTFHLRPGVTFSDGTPLTADVVKANFDDILANKTANTGAGTVTVLQQSGYVGTEVAGPLTVTQNFSKPNVAWALQVTGPQYGILAAATLALPFADRATKIIGTGPFVLDSYTKNSQVVLTRRTGYQWSPPFAAHQGDAYLDTIVYKVISEPSVRTGALQSGQIQIATSLQPSDVEVVREVGATVITKPIPRNTEALVVTSADRPPLNDLLVRQAITKAVDTKEIRDAVLSPDFKLPVSILTSSVVGHADQSALLAPDVKAAGALLDQAGWLAGPDGIRAKNGTKLSLRFGWIDRGNPWDQPMVELLKAQFAKVGIDFQPRLDTVANAVAALRSHTQYDLFLAGASGDITGDQRAAFTNSPPNLYNVQDTELQTLLARWGNAVDAAASTKASADVQARVIGQGIAIPLVEDTAIVASSEQVHGFALAATARIPSMYDVWLS